jgi:hypothetical protein
MSIKDEYRSLLKHHCLHCDAGEGQLHQSTCPVIVWRAADQAMAGQAQTNKADLVNSPPHYRQGDVECIDAIESALTAEEFRGYCKGNALKYIWRERHKGQDESLKKAIWYLERIPKA